MQTTQPLTATQLLALAKTLGITGQFVRAFRNGQELRAYAIPHHGVTKIRALPHQHA